MHCLGACMGVVDEFLDGSIKGLRAFFGQGIGPDQLRHLPVLRDNGIWIERTFNRLREIAGVCTKGNDPSLSSQEDGNSAKKAVGERMGISSKGERTSRSSSPDTR